ncbi:MAG: GTP-binding protein [Anaerolineae bacterium]
MFINRRKKELSLKIVYYGPALSGKTTNLEYIHAHTNPGMRGDLVSLKTREDRTIFFDYLMLEVGQVAGLTPKFNLYTVPGQVYYASTRKLVLQGADGIVFVADSQPHRMEANLEGLRDMATYMRQMGLDPRQIPVIIQFNKQDLAEALSPSQIRRGLKLQNTTLTCLDASALYGEGVFDTLKTIINSVIKQVQRQIRQRETQRALVH